MNHENDKNTLTELFKWLDYNYVLERNTEALRFIKRRLEVVEENYAHIKFVEEYFFSTSLQMREVSRNIKHIKALIRSSMIRNRRIEFEIHFAVIHVEKSFLNLNNTQRVIAMMQEKHVKTLDNLIIRNDFIIIDYVDGDFSKKTLSESKPT